MIADSTNSPRGMSTENLADGNPAVVGPINREERAPVDEGLREILPGYKLLERIGAGGYGTVWRAEAPGGLAKAIKIVHGQFDEKRAADEWKALCHVKAVRHPFLLSLERIEVVNQQLVVVTELADGSLKDRFDRFNASGRPGIPRDELLAYLAEAADALDYMSSEHGLQHLDVKPENLLLVGNHVKVADFGLVKNVHGSSISMIAGLTPMFSAPETFDGRPTDRSDQYSLAVVYQFLLTGKCPFPGQTFAQLASQHLNARPDVSPLPEADRAIIEHALAKDPFDRFSSCRALVDRLRKTVAAAPRAARAERLPSRPLADGATRQGRVEFATEIVDVATPIEAEKGASDTENIPSRRATEIVDLPALQLESDGRFHPTLIIGLGGCGIRALRGLEERLRKQWGPIAAIPSLRMLAIDTDDKHRPLVPVTSNDEYDDPLLHIPLKPTQYYRRQADDLTRWLNRRWIYNIPKTMKTEGIRPLGRLALVDHIERVDQRLRKELATMADKESIAASSVVLKCPVDHRKMRVLIVGSISSGTSGGIVWDIVQLIHQALPQDAGVQREVACVLAHWTTNSPKEIELATANTCAALLELQHYMSEGCPGDPSLHLPALGRHHNLFENVYLIDLGSHDNDSSFDAASSPLAEYLHANVNPRCGAFISACRQAHGTMCRSHAGLRTFGFTRISDSDLAAVEQLARQLVDPTLPPEKRLTTARRKTIDELLAKRVACIQPSFLAGGGARRFLIATSHDLQKAGFMGLVQHHLPAAATATTHDDEGILLLCECQGIAPSDVAWLIAENRPDLFALGTRLVTRSDVAWSPL